MYCTVVVSSRGGAVGSVRSGIGCDGSEAGDYQEYGSLVGVRVTLSLDIAVMSLSLGTPTWLPE